ncbi:hypothetical protein KR51_00001100 [Rubidibacter lacunae KORDI 51-2]|uniref:Uncharacterized protein n=1 Tax=Rubidibacter lacunae KORDI 51-2 TaxID=582515 RepID=U5DFE5_9CHRO|nr:hypothetical protein KR51_00001100 [Rubidibacter lacunae KORDI 51-2]
MQYGYRRVSLEYFEDCATYRRKKESTKDEQLLHALLEDYFCLEYILEGWTSGAFPSQLAERLLLVS